MRCNGGSTAEMRLVLSVHKTVEKVLRVSIGMMAFGCSWEEKDYPVGANIKQDLP